MCKQRHFSLVGQNFSWIEQVGHGLDEGDGGSPRQVKNRRRRTREGPELACVQTPFCDRVAHAGRRKDEFTSCGGTVQSAWQKPPVRRKGGRAELPQKGKWPPRGTGDDRPHVSAPR